jgi:hypothetical protein
MASSFKLKIATQVCICRFASEETPMRTLLSIIVFSLIFAVAAPAFAGGTPKTKADCEKAHMKWDATAKKCS